MQMCISIQLKGIPQKNTNKSDLLLSTSQKTILPEIIFQLHHNFFAHQRLEERIKQLKTEINNQFV